MSLRQAAPAVGLAAVWVALQTAGEITVTDLGMVRTFAEEVYTQFVTDSPAALGRAVALALPMTTAAVLVVGILLRGWAGRLAVVRVGPAAAGSRARRHGGGRRSPGCFSSWRPTRACRS